VKVAIDYTPAAKQRAGIGRFVRDLVDAILSGAPDLDITLVVTNDCPPDRMPSNVRIRRLPFSERLGLILWHRLHVPVAIERFIGEHDVVHGTNFLLPPLRRAAGVVTVHDLTFLVHPEFAEPSLAAFLQRALPDSVRRASAICADSTATKGDLVARLGVDPDRVTVILGGVSPRFRPATPAKLEALAARYPFDRPFVLALGTREPRKNLAGLLEAYERVRQRGIRARLLVAGPDGWRQERFAGQLASSPFRDDVISLGFVPDDDLPALLSASSCFCYPSFYEGFGLPVAEALACGAPVVCSNTSSLPEVAGDAAILVSPADPAAIAAAIADVLTNRTLADRLRRCGPAQAATFDWATSARRQLDVYRRVAA
jgi:glycosyltransferase involved in cell wall biosynthesis